jgi:CcmD family protein
MKKITCFISLLLSFVSAFAQSPSSVEMADEMRKSGKIYVVIAVIVVVFAGLAIYLFSMDRRLKKLERDRDI